MNMKKIGSWVICAVLLISLLVPATVGTVSANARPIVIDFSRNDFVMNNISADATMDVVNADGRRVIRVEIVNGADPDDPDDGAGDPHATVADFEDYELDGDVYQWVRISYRNVSNAPWFEFHFASPTRGFHISTSFNVAIEPNSGWTYSVANVLTNLEHDFPKRPADADTDEWVNHWAGHINNLRLDFMYYEEPGGRARTGDVIYVEYIAFFDSEEAARAFQFTPTRTVEQIEQDAAEREAAREAALQEAEAAAAEDTAQDAAAGDDGDDDDTADSGETGAETPTTTAAGNDDSDGVNPIIFIIIAVVAVAIIIIIVVTASKNKKKQA